MIPPKVNFVELSEKELDSRLNAIIKNSLPLKIWKKGDSQKQDYLFQFCEPVEKRLVSESPLANLLDHNVLFNFQYNGQSFFGKAKVQFDHEQEYYFLGSVIIYKSERRKNYRLLCYPTFELISRFVVNESFKEENIYSLTSKENYDSIKMDFLGYHYKIDNQDIGKIVRTRVHDISATGLGVYIGDLEKKFFDNDKLFKNTKIQFFNEVLTIPLIKVVYTMPAKVEANGVYRVGLNFEEITEDIEQAIVRKINQILKEYDFDKEFEDFI